MDIKTLSFGCRLNALENEKIAKTLAPHIECAILVNTCAVTNEAERQSGQAIRKLARENPNAPIFVTGCAATRNPGLFSEIPNTVVIDNAVKMKLDEYLNAIDHTSIGQTTPIKMRQTGGKLSKQFVQIQNGCDHLCTYCVTRLVRGRAVSFPYEVILTDVRAAVANGFFEIVLTGVDIASYNSPLHISGLCDKLLSDVPEIKRLRLSSMDPASPEIPKIIELMRTDARMMKHLHLSMQSGSNLILAAMKRRHNADMVRKFVKSAPDVSFSWDIICGFPGETDELFNETLELVRELKPIKIHAFPFSPRPGTVAADMPNHVNRNVSKQRVKTISDLADENCRELMKKQVGTIVQVLVEEKNIARTPDDIAVKITGSTVPERTICNVKLTDISGLQFLGEINQ